MRTLKIAVVSGLCFLGTLSSGTALANEAGAEASVAVEHVAMVRLQIRVGDKVLRAPVRAVRWGDRATFVIEGAGGRHVVRLRPEATSGRASVQLSYERDGASLASDARRDVQPRRTTAVFSDEHVSIAVTIIPTRVSIAAN